MVIGTDSLHAQSIEVSLDPQSWWRAPIVRLADFPADSEVEVSFTRTPPDGQPPSFRSAARYLTDANGSVFLSSRPTGGDWTLPLPEAPFWTMRPDPAAPLLAPGVVRVEARAGSLSRSADYRISEPVGIKTEPVREFAGAFLVRPEAATKPLPLIIVLGGSGGNGDTARNVAPLFAAAGFAALGLPYISPDRGNGQAISGLPASFSNIPVERLDQVRQWASTDPRIDAGRIGVWGVSKGAEFALLAAANFQWIAAAAAIVPSDVVWEGFSYTTTAGTGQPSFSLNGRPLPYVRYSAPGRGRDVKLGGRRADPSRAAAARIPVERFAGPLLVAGGERDLSWDSAGMSQAIAERRAEVGLPTISLIFPDAGHDLDPSFLDPIEPEGGDGAELVGKAKLQLWEATLELFRTALGEEPGGAPARP